MPNMRTHVVLPGDLVAAIDHLVGKRGRSSFLKQAAWEEVKRQRLLRDRKSTRLNSSHLVISYAVFCLKKQVEPRRLRVVSRHRCPLAETAGEDTDRVVIVIRHLFFLNDSRPTDSGPLPLHAPLPV